MSAVAPVADRNWLVVVGAIFLAGALFMVGRGRPPAPGDHVLLPVTVIPSDARDLDCASSEEFAGSRCAFDAEGHPLPSGNPLRPFMTTYRELFLLTGVFEEPNVAGWLEAARGSDERVTLQCDCVLLGKAPAAGVHWRVGSRFDPVQDVPVARVQRCRVIR